MPTYDYLCDACDHKFELFQSIKDEAERRCPKCRKLKLRRLFGTGAAIMFKGSGFYTTDYRSDSYKKGAKADSSSGENKSSGDGKSSGESKSGGESKPTSESKSNESSSKNSSSESKGTSKKAKE
jgi:putative FmdB family regulatory protein